MNYVSTRGIAPSLTASQAILQGLNLLKATDLKVMNYTPAIFLPIAFCPLMDWLTGLL